MVQDWSTLNRPASVYWLTSDGSVQAEVYATLGPTLLLSNQIAPSMYCKWVEEYESAMVRAGTPGHLRHAAFAWILMRSIYHLENDFPLILTELLLNILQWHEFAEEEAPSDEEKEQAVNVWRNLDREFHDEQLNLCEFYAGFPNEMKTLNVGLLCRGHLTFREARIISHVIRRDAKQIGDYQSAHDIRTSYLTFCNGSNFHR